MAPKGMLGLLALGLSTMALGGAATRSTDAPARSCAAVAGSQVCTWLEMDGDTPVELGATIPMALIQGVPADAEMVWPPEELGSVALPEQARAALGIDHLGINWEAHGHPPTPFMTPHFDFHFYNIAPAQVGAIDCSDSSEPAALPAPYVLPDVDVPGMGTLVGLCVPKMGMHAMPEGDLAGNGPFQASMVLGYYHGSPIFFEPMISQARLLKGADFTLPMPPVQHLPSGVRYPTEFQATYDAANQEYRLVFSGFGSATEDGR